MGQNRKCSVRAEHFRITPNSGQPLTLRSGHIRQTKVSADWPGLCICHALWAKTAASSTATRDSSESYRVTKCPFSCTAHCIEPGLVMLKLIETVVPGTYVICVCCAKA